MSFVGGDRRDPLGGDFGEPFAGEDEERREAGGVPEDGWLNSAPAVLFGLGVERDVVFFGVGLSECAHVEYGYCAICAPCPL